jgi:hypothetical protein
MYEVQKREAAMSENRPTSIQEEILVAIRNEWEKPGASPPPEPRPPALTLDEHLVVFADIMEYHNASLPNDLPYLKEQVMEIPKV